MIPKLNGTMAFGQNASTMGNQRQQSAVPSFASQMANPKRRTAEENARAGGWGVMSSDAGGKGESARKIVMGRSLVRGAITDTKPLSEFESSLQQPDPLQQAALYDQQQLQGAADEQWGRNNQQNARMDAWLQNLGPGVLEPAQRDADQLRDIGSETLQKGRGIEDPYNRDADRIMKQGEGDIAAARAEGRRAVQEMEGASSNYSNNMAMDMSAVASGIRQMYAAAKKELMGPTVDGRVRTEDEIRQGTAELKRNTEVAVQQAITPLVSQWNNTKAALKQAVGQMRMNNANLLLQGAGQLAQSASAAAGIRSTGAGLRMQNTQLATGLFQAASQLEQGSMLAVAQLEAQGLTQLAQLVQQNPRTVTSWFQTLLAMEGVQAADRDQGSQPAKQPAQAGQPATSASPKNQAKNPRKSDADFNKERAAKGKAVKEGRAQKAAGEKAGRVAQIAQDPTVGEWGDQGFSTEDQRPSPGPSQGRIPGWMRGQTAMTNAQAQGKVGGKTIGDVSDRLQFYDPQNTDW